MKKRTKIEITLCSDVDTLDLSGEINNAINKIRHHIYDLKITEDRRYNGKDIGEHDKKGKQKGFKIKNR